MQHPKCCTKNLTVVKFDPTSSNMLQHLATYRYRVAKRTQHVVPNNVARCCVEMLGAFGQALSIEINHSIRHFLQMLRRGESGTSAFNWPDVATFLVLMLRFVFTRRKRTKNFDPSACACVNPVFTGK